MTKTIQIKLPEDVLKHLEDIAAIDGKEVTEIAEKILSLYVGRYENVVRGSIRAAENIKKNVKER